MNKNYDINKKSQNLIKKRFAPITLTENQKELIAAAKKDIENFCIINNIAIPKICIKYENKFVGGCGWFVEGLNKIFIAPKICTKPTKTPGFCWSYPNYFVDKTCYGVLLHEFGHYVHYLLSHPVIPIETPITSYEPDEGERFAETMKIFVGNPDLLKHSNPRRYNFLLKLGLKPSKKSSWKILLKDAHPRFIKAVENRIRKVL